MVEDIELGRERAHAVAEQHQRLAVFRLTRELRHRDHVVDQGWETSRSEVSQLVGPRGEFAVTTVVVGVNGIARFDERMRDRAVAQRMFAHAMSDLHGPAGRRRVLPPMHPDRLVVGGGDRDCGFVDGHRHFSLEFVESSLVFVRRSLRVARFDCASGASRGFASLGSPNPERLDQGECGDGQRYEFGGDLLRPRHDRSIPRPLSP